MGLITPILFVALSVGAFLYYIDPTYSGKKDVDGVTKSGILELQTSVVEHAAAVNNSNALRELRTKLEEDYKKIDSDEKERLDKFLPDTLDSVRLMNYFSNFAKNRGMRLENFKVEQLPESTPQGELASATEKKYYATGISFGIKGSYATIRTFIRELESSLRLVEIESMTFGAGEEGIYSASFDLKTYWYKK